MIDLIMNYFFSNDQRQSNDLKIRIDTLINKILKENNIPGLGVMVVLNDQEIVSKGYGMANLELGVKVNERIMFQSGSVGKMFTAAGIMILVENGQVKLDDKILSWDDINKKWVSASISHIHKRDVDKVYKVTLSNGNEIEVSENDKEEPEQIEDTKEEQEEPQQEQKESSKEKYESHNLIISFIENSLIK